MIEQSDIFVDNFREALRQVDRAIAWGMGAGLSVFALSIASGGKAAEFSFGFASFDGSFGFVLALAVHFILGVVGTSTVIRVGEIAKRLRPEILTALKTFPSVVTWKSNALRFLTAILPGLLVFAGFIYAHIRRNPSARSELGWVVAIAFPFLASYLMFAIYIGQCHAFFPDQSRQRTKNQ